MRYDREDVSPMITTIIPTYKRPQLLKRAIESVLAQSYPNFMVIVCDNHSEDDTRSIVEAFRKEDGRICYFCHSKNIGPINNFNFGLRQVKTPFFTILSDDNELKPHFFKTALELANRHPEAAIIAGRTARETLSGKARKVGIDRWDEKLYFPPEGLVSLFEKGMLTWESILFRRKVLDTIGFLNPEVSGSADRDFVARILANFPALVVKETFASFLVHEGFTTRRPLKEFYESHQKIIQQFLDDNRIPKHAKERIQRAGRKQIMKLVTSNIYSKTILQRDMETITFAESIMKLEYPDSLKMKIVLFVGRVYLEHTGRKWVERVIRSLAAKYLDFRKNSFVFFNSWKRS